MKTMLLAAAAVLSLGVGSAYADGGDLLPDTRFTEIPGVLAQPSAQRPALVQNGQAVHTYVSRSNKGTWLFAPDQNGGSNS